MSTINVNVTTQTDITAQNGAESDRKVALAAFNGRVYMAYRGWGASKNMYICSTANGTTWGTQSSITDSNDAKTQSSPALAAFNGRLYLAYQGANSDNLYICSSSDGVNFGDQTEITKQNSAETTSQPALAAFNGRLYLAYRGTGLSTNLYVCSSSNGTDWGSQTNVSDQNGAASTTTAGPALAAFEGKLYLGWEGASGTGINGAALYVCASSNGTEWGPQTNLEDANGAEGYDGLSLAATSNTLFAIYHGAHTAQFYGCGFDGTTWSTNQINFSSLNEAGSAWGPALAALGDTFYTAYPGIGVSNNLWDFTFTTSWSNQ
ncbi:MAG: exo-alpha-sialidase [Betaproteobacteria bacterium]|nr:exo-alpha-sialidase [Betaproteobacteria bacterium]